MYKLKSIEMDAFRGVTAPQSVENLPLNGLIGIDGKNLLTGGSSGAGKSSFLLAITHIMGISPFPATKEQNLYSSKKMQLAATIVNDETGEEFTVFKGKINRVVKNGQVLVEGASGTTDFVAKLWKDVPKDMLTALSYRQQREKGRFVNMDPPKRQAFLSKVLGLDEVEELAGELRKQLTQYTTERDQKEQTVKVIQAGIPKEPIKPQEPVVEWKGYSIPYAEFTKCLDSFKAQFVDKAKETYKQKQEELQKEMNDEYSSYTSRMQKLQGEYQNLKVQIQHSINTDESLLEDQKKLDEVMKKMEEGKEVIREADKRKLAYQATAAKVMQDILAQADVHKQTIATEPQVMKSIQREFDTREHHYQDLKQVEYGVCPTCLRDWQDADALVWKQKLTENIEKATQALIELEIKKNKIAFAKEEVARIAAEADTQKKEDAEMLAKYDDVIHTQHVKMKAHATVKYELEQEIGQQKKLLSELRNDYLQELENMIQALNIEHKNNIRIIDARDASARAEMTAVTAEYDELRNKFNLVQNVYLHDVHAYGHEHSHYTVQMKRLADADVALHDVDLKVRTTEDTLSCVKGYLNAITEEFLADIASEANEMLRQLKNTETSTIRFIPVPSANRYSINIEITRGGAVFDFDANLSGGQQASTELAIDLAIVLAISRRRNDAVPGWMLIDEAFEGHDVPVKEGCLEVLRAFAQKRQVFIIDHASEFKEYYSCKVVARYDGSTSFQVER